MINSTKSVHWIQIFSLFKFSKIFSSIFTSRWSIKNKDHIFNHLNYSLWYRDITTLAVISNTWNKTTVYCGYKNRHRIKQGFLFSPFTWTFFTLINIFYLYTDKKNCWINLIAILPWTPQSGYPDWLNAFQWKPSNINKQII